MDSNSLDKIKQKFDRWCDSDIDTDESWLAELETEPENKALASGFMGGYKAAKADALREAAEKMKLKAYRTIINCRPSCVVNYDDVTAILSDKQESTDADS